MHKETVNILLVEDDEIDVLKVKRAFTRNNMTNPLFVAQNGLEALDYLRGENGATKVELPRVILLDLNMPKMNGFEFLEHVRNDPELRISTIYVMTTSDDEKDVLEAFKFLIAGYIVKPLDVEKFIAALKVLNKCWEISDFPIKLNI